MVGIVFLGGKREHGAKDDRDFFRAEKILDLIGFFASGKDHFQLLLIEEFDGIANVACAIGEHQDRQFAANDGCKRFKLQVAIVFRDGALFHRLSVVAGAVQPIREFVDLLVVFLFGLGVGLFFAGEG